MNNFSSRRPPKKSRDEKLEMAIRAAIAWLERAPTPQLKKSAMRRMYKLIKVRSAIAILKMEQRRGLM